MKDISKSRQMDFMLYKKTAETYDLERFTGMSGAWGHYRQVLILENVVQDWQGKKVLEIGSGTGRITEALTRWGARVTATDITEEMLEVAKARFSTEQASSVPEFRLMSVFEVNIDLKEYDYIIMVNVLGHLSQPRNAIQSISSRMSRTCRFVFNFPCLTSIMFPFGLLVNARGKSVARAVTSQWYTPGKMEKYCKDAGLVIVRWRGNHYVPIPRVLSPTLPFFRAFEALLAEPFPKRCPSVFIECRLQ